MEPKQKLSLILAMLILTSDVARADFGFTFGAIVAGVAVFTAIARYASNFSDFATVISDWMKENHSFLSAKFSNINIFQLVSWTMDYRYKANQLDNWLTKFFTFMKSNEAPKDEDVSNWLININPPPTLGKEDESFLVLFEYFHRDLLSPVCKREHLKRLSCKHKDCETGKFLFSFLCYD